MGGNKQAIVLMSGGIDSAACAHLLIGQGLSVSAVFIDYGQAALAAEKNAATHMAEHLEITLRRFNVFGSEPFGTGELPGRNAFLAMAAVFLMRAPPGIIAMGVHGGTPYYDCSERFAESMARLVAEQTDGRTIFVAPFISWNKQDIYDYFQKAGLPIDLTYSCERGPVPPCGICASCRDRRSLRC